MNYFTFKKAAALSFVSLMAVGAVNAQTTSDPAATTNAKVFGGSGQYNTWSIGFNLGVTSEKLATGGSNTFDGNVPAFGYGISLRDQLAHSFGVQLDLRGGQVRGDSRGGGVPDVSQNLSYTPGSQFFTSYKTNFYQGSISGVVNVATVDYLRRKNAINFFLTGGVGLAMYNPTPTRVNGAAVQYINADGSAHWVKELFIPVGAGVKFRMTDALALNLGYTENFIDNDNFDGVHRVDPQKDKYSYAYAGLEFTLGSKSKPSLEWVNPVAMMYDELYDEALRQEVAALKGRVTNVENAVNDLKKDSDGDGVSDQFDKCPNTPAGTVVDGSGCAIVFPKPIDTSLFMRKPIAGAATAYSNIQFEFDSSVLRTSSYPVLDASSADLRTSGATIELDGYASSEGTAAHNLRLSKDRANSVKTYLVNSGVDAKHLKVKAFGETNPIATNDTEEGRVLNRRVEFKK